MLMLMLRMIMISRNDIITPYPTLSLYIYIPLLLYLFPTFSSGIIPCSHTFSLPLVRYRSLIATLIPSILSPPSFPPQICG